MSELKAVFFDVQNTLWDRSACDLHVMQVILPRFMARLPAEEVEEVIHRFNVAFCGLPRKEHLRERRPFSHLARFAALLDSYDIRDRDLARKMAHTYDHTRRMIMRSFLRQDALAVLDELGRRQLQRGAMLNGPPAAQRHLVQSLGLDHRLDHVMLCETEGYVKPDMRIFRRALQVADVSGLEMLYVGDSPLTDLLGGARAGIRTVWLRTGRRGIPAGFPQPDYTIAHLSELLSIL